MRWLVDHVGNAMERVTINDGTLWPNPKGQDYHDCAWRMIHHPEAVTPAEMMSAASVMEAYNMLVTHPALTLKKVSKKVSGIREAIK